MSGMNVNPRGSSTTPGDDATYVPDPCLIVTMLREASNFMASRRELLPILSSLARCASLGSLSPDCKCSFNIKILCLRKSSVEDFSHQIQNSSYDSYAPMLVILMI